MKLKCKMLGVAVAAGLVLGVAHAGNDRNFGAHLNGGANVPPTGSHAQGQLILKNEGDDGLEYKLIVANLSDITVSHIHCAPEGQNGPAGVTLIQLGAPITVNGILSQGPILAPNEGNACGWLTTDDIVDAIKAGNAYVNVHTLNYPGGEIRGQLR